MAPSTKRTTTMNWDDLVSSSSGSDDDDEFYESKNRVSSAAPLDLYATSNAAAAAAIPLDVLYEDSDDDDADDQFEDSRVSFTVHPLRKPSSLSVAASPSAQPLPPPSSMENYGVWMAAPGSITERRKRLLYGMGINSNKDLSRLTTMKLSKKFSHKVAHNNPPPPPPPSSVPESHVTANVTPPDPHPKPLEQPPETSPPTTAAGDEQSPAEPPPPVDSPTVEETMEIVLFRSRSDGDMESFHTKRRRAEMIGDNVSKQRLTRTPSTLAPMAKMCRLKVNSMRIRRNVEEGGDQAEKSRHRKGRGGANSKSDVSVSQAFFLIKNLDTGKEFIVKEFGEDGTWNRLSDLQTGKQLTMDEFEKSVGTSPVVKELMRRQNAGRGGAHGGLEKKMSTAITKSFRYSKKKSASFLKNIKSSVTGSFNAEKEIPILSDPEHQHQQQQHKSIEWVKVRQVGKPYKEFTALRLCQEIQAHEGSIWTMRFNAAGSHLASAGEDKVIHVWEVQECEIATLLPQEDGGCAGLAACPSPDKNQAAGKKGKSASRRGGTMPDYVQLPETVFGLSEKPSCSFTGHLDDILDVSWSTSQLQLLSSSMDKTVRLWDLNTKSCLRLFAHNDYVTCIHFNPVDDNYFVSGSLDAKLRIWNVPGKRVVDWVDFHEMVTAACYSPDGQSAAVGSHKGNWKVYSTTEGKLSQMSQASLPFKTKKVAKITGFEFTPGAPSEVLITSADSRIRIFDGQEMVHKYMGLQNNNSQIAAAYTPCGKHVICASEDSHVFVWQREEAKQPSAAGGKAKPAVNVRTYEQFHCKDVSVAIPWPGCAKFEAPTVSLNPKKAAKKPPAGATSPKAEAANKKPHLPPLPKKPAEKAAAEKHEEAEEKEEGEGDAIKKEDAAAAPSASWSPGWSWLDGGGNGGNQETVQATAWGLVIVTAGLGGEIKAFQNLGLPVRVGKQKNLFS